MRHLTETEISEIVADAWDDETSFEDINYIWSLSEKDIKFLMKRSLKRTSYIIWRKKVNKRLSKHSLKSSHVYPTLVVFRIYHLRICKNLDLLH